MADGIVMPDLSGLKSRLREAQKLLGSTEPVLKLWRLVVLRDIAQTFRVGGQPAWAPLAPGTIAARREGKGDGGAKPLVRTGGPGSLSHSFDGIVTGNRLTIFSNNPIAPLMEFGTQPHDIEAKPGHVLAIPTGPFTLAGLGKSRATGRGSFIFSPAGRRPPKRLRGREGKAVVPYASVIFRHKVHHPGTVPRPMLPAPDRIVPELNKQATAFILKKLLMRSENG